MVTITQAELEKLSELAYLESEQEQSMQLVKEMNSILHFVQQLQSIDTQEVLPLFHPLDTYQALRTDKAIEEDCIAQLEAIAPLFEDNYYLVPKVIDEE